MSSKNATEIQEPEYEATNAHRNHLKEQIQLKAGFDAHEFQLDAVVATMAGKDVIVHAGTGSGKTLIFAAPHFIQHNRTSVLISPLILLQQYQQEPMKRIGVEAIAVNKEVHLEAKDWDDIQNRKYQIVLLSPEMALHSEQMHKVFDSKSFRNALIAMFVDEAHTISLWGGDFRKDYSGFGRIRARLPRGIPVSAVSATLRPKVKHDVLSTLGFSADTSKYVDINIGNERKNVYIGVRSVKSPSSSFRDLSFLIPSDATTSLDIPKAIIYIDDVVDVTLAVITLNGWLCPLLQDQGLIMPVHAWMPPSYRSDATAKLFSGLIRIIICTEAAGMTLSEWFSIGYVNLSVCNDIVFARFQQPANVKYVNEVYKNPSHDNPVPNNRCCDLCDEEANKRLVYHTFNARDPIITARAAAVSGKSDPQAFEFLRKWRREEFLKKFGATRMFGAAVLISDEDLMRISRCTPVPSIEQLRRYLIKWIYVDTLLESMWDSLQDAGFAVPNAAEPEDVSIVIPSESSPRPRATANPVTSSCTQRPNTRLTPLNISASNNTQHLSLRSVAAPSGASHSVTGSSHPPPTPSFPPPKRRYIETVSGNSPSSQALPRSLALLRAFMGTASQPSRTADNQSIQLPSAARSHSRHVEHNNSNVNILKPIPTLSSRLHVFLDRFDTSMHVDHLAPAVIPSLPPPPRPFLADPRSQITQLLNLRSILLSN